MTEMSSKIFIRMQIFFTKNQTNTLNQNLTVYAFMQNPNRTLLKSLDRFFATICSFLSVYHVNFKIMKKSEDSIAGYPSQLPFFLRQIQIPYFLPCRFLRSETFGMNSPFRYSPLLHPTAMSSLVNAVIKSADGLSL